MRETLEPKDLAPEKATKQNLFTHHSPPDSVGFAVVGLGEFCLANILPAFDLCENARLTAIVSANQERALRIANGHDIARGSVYTFLDFDRIKDDRQVQVVYVALHGALRDQMILRAARAGKHVICEGRFSGDTKIDHKIAQVCDEAGVKLMMTFRHASAPHSFTALQLDHMANCILRHRAPLRLSDVLGGFEAPRIDVARWAN